VFAACATTGCADGSWALARTSGAAVVTRTTAVKKLLLCMVPPLAVGLPDLCIDELVT
jgi:hypothetical protein